MPILEIKFHSKIFFEESCFSSLEEASTQHLKAMMQGLRCLISARSSRLKADSMITLTNSSKQNRIKSHNNTALKDLRNLLSKLKNSERNLKLKMENKKIKS